MAIGCGGRTRLVLRALVAKSWTIKRRHPFATWSEVLNPLLCILLFAALKSFETDLEIPAGWATSKANASVPTLGTTWNLYGATNLSESLTEGLSSAGIAIPTPSSSGSGSNSTPAIGELLKTLTSSLSIPKFYFTEATMPGFLLSLSLQALMEGDKLDELSQDDLMSCALKFLLMGYTGAEGTTYHVPSACQGKIIPYKIAITPDTTYTREYFAGALETWYPRIALTPSTRGLSLFTTPSFADSYVFFDNETVMETYISSKEYGIDLEHPKIYAAIAFQDFPKETSAFGDVKGHSIAYSLRFNATSAVSSTVPTTKKPRPNSISKFAPADAVMSYATRGFMTLQTAVARFLNCMPVWDSQSQSTTGSCQILEAVMPADGESDRRLLRQFKHDMIIDSAFKLLESAQDLIGQSAAVNLSGLLVDTIPALSVEKLLLPLRMAPQPYHGAGVYDTPTQSFHYGLFFDKVALVFPIGFVLSYLYMVSRVIVTFLVEKETRSRELMRILGAQDNELFAGCVLAYIPILILGAFLQTLGAHAMLFPSSDARLLFVFFLTFAASSFGYGFLISTLFSRARAGSLAGMGLFFMMFFVSFSFSDDTSEATRTFASLLAPVSLSQGVSVIARLESFEVGVTSQNAHELVEGFRFVNAIAMQILDTLLYVLAGKYFEKVIPQEFGVAEKWYFFLTKAFWCPHASRIVSAELRSIEKASTTMDTSTIEAITSNLKQQEEDGRAVVIANLRKEFSVPGGTKVAVHGLDLTLYEGQITCLLGHNGAGKTTVMAMLTGMTPPSSGNAWVRGYSVVSDMPSIRQSLGYCPQHGVLYPDLTVAEHLTFYGRLKGFSDAKALAQEVASKIDEMGLQDKRHVWARALSGGMQRKLSLAIAFLGDSAVVFLDEPTAGMDPYSRRSTWELIQRNRTGRVVILTTHFMDEADILGDRIAIMAEGRLQCVGSSLFLKKRFGVGYRLSFVRRDGGATDQLRAEEAESASIPQSIVDLVQQHVPQAAVTSDIGTELVFQLPFEASPKFPALFREIEATQRELGILSFVISVTTLEEIFLKVAEGGCILEKAVDGVDTMTSGGLPPPTAESWETVIPVKPTGANTQDAPSRASELQKQKGESLPAIRAFMNQMDALLRKRLLCGKRDFNMLFFSTALPIVVVVIGLSALKFSTLLQDAPKLLLSPTEQYSLGERTPVPFSCPGNVSENAETSWCSDLVQPTYFTEGVPYELDVEARVYNSSTSPTVFGVTYTSPAIEPNDTSGYCLRFGELAFETGYGYATDAPLSTPTQSPMEGQFGGYLLYASEATHTLSYNILANGSSTHAAPTYKSMIDGAIHRFLLSKAGQPSGNVTISVSSHPLPLSFTSRSIFSSYLSFPAVLTIVIAFTFIPASMMPFVVKEKQREQNAKHQQLLSGVSLVAYWLANFVFDVALYLVPMAATILLLRSYGVTASLSGVEPCKTCTQDVPAAMVTLFMLFGAAVVPWTYLLSHVMKQPSDCLLYTIMINFFVGILLLLLSFSMNSLDATRGVNNVLVYIWRCSPLFAFGNGILNVVVADLLALLGLTSEARSAFDTDIAGTDILYLGLQCPVFYMLAVGIDMMRTGTIQWQIPQFLTKFCNFRPIYQRVPCNNTKLHVQEPHNGKVLTDEMTVDEDVAVEAQRVNQSSPEFGSENTLCDPLFSSEVVQIFKLQQVYPNGKRAVKNLSFGLQQGECFGFLGVNGAGKTTTMKVLTGDLLPTSGTAKLNGFDIRTERRQARESIGYCPQFDALIDLLTVREHLELYGRLKGFQSPENLRREVNRLLEKLQIQSFASKLAGSLSGGNKRKLSLAIAMLGDPKVLVLDEPSTGVDPFSRRLLWAVILEASVLSRRSTVLLTTHSMEECEALCSKAGIMVDGSLRCFGSVPHLKLRFGDGFMMECKLNAPPSALITDLMRQVCDQLQLPIENEGKEAKLAASQLEETCVALGDPQRAQCSALRAQVDRGDGSVGLASFCDWWVSEDRMQRLDNFLRVQFDGVTLIERQADFCRYKLYGDALNRGNREEGENDADLEEGRAAMQISRMFEVVEEAKAALSIKEYSLSQTSLEQIFNGFARQGGAAADPKGDDENRQANDHSATNSTHNTD
ncbi:hypothetical protein BBJ28_00003724 [Nothophytophthora sp. Chile5]|nr:hypothetical protein BBJ28_00003724 [Nothophytophthora sp. Chile5]